MSLRMNLHTVQPVVGLMTMATATKWPLCNRLHKLQLRAFQVIVISLQRRCWLAKMILCSDERMFIRRWTEKADLQQVHCVSYSISLLRSNIVWSHLSCTWPWFRMCPMDWIKCSSLSLALQSRVHLVWCPRLTCHFAWVMMIRMGLGHRAIALYKWKWALFIFPTATL